MHTWVGRVFRAIDAVTVDLFHGLTDALKRFYNGPVQGLLFRIILLFTAISVITRAVGATLDRWLGAVERAFVGVSMLVMTLLAFNEYLQREFRPRFGDLGGIWALDGQMNMALLLMVVVGFIGASLATRDGKHMAVDAADRVLAPPARAWVRLIRNWVAAGLCFAFMHGGWTAVFTHSQDSFEGAKVWSPLVMPINAVVSVLPGEKFGPKSCAVHGTDAVKRSAASCPTVEFATGDNWLDAKYDEGLDPYELYSFGYVDAGDRFPLWAPLMLLVSAFGVMGLRFFARGTNPGGIPRRNPGIPPPVVGTRRRTDVVLAGAVPGALIVLGLGAWLGQGWMILLASILLVILGSPLFVAVGVGTLACWVMMRGGSAETVVSDMFEATKKQELLAIPFFVLAGNLMTRGTIAARLIDVAKAMMGHIPGGLGAGSVIACAFFAAISGSSPVTVIAIGGLMFPMLLKEGYSERYSMGVLTTAGGLGIIIPPSIPMIVYAIMVSGNPEVGVIDPAKLFKAGILPGLFIASTLIGYTFFTQWPRDLAEQPKSIPMGEWIRGIGKALSRGVASMMLPVLILGGIYGWLDFAPLGLDVAIRFTVTEAAAVAVIYALFVELVLHRELKWRDLPNVFADSAIMMGSLFMILVVAISLNRFFVFEQVPEAATAFMLEHVDSRITFLILVNVFLLLLGCVMDILSAILIVAPLLAPIAASYGIHPIHFGIMFIVNLELGYLTPPLGLNLFVASTVFERSILEVIRAVIPFLVLMLFCLVVIVWFPSLSLLLVE